MILEVGEEWSGTVIDGAGTVVGGVGVSLCKDYSEVVIREVRLNWLYLILAISLLLYYIIIRLLLFCIVSVLN